MSEAPFSIKKGMGAWDAFFFRQVEPTVFSILRIGYAFLLLVNLLVLLPDLEKWFGEHGVLTFEASRQIIDSDTLTLFSWLPKTDAVLWVCFSLFLGQTLALMLGFFSRFQAFCIFIWWQTFEHRHLIIFDAEDNLFRLFALLLFLAPCGLKLSLDAWLKKKRGKEPAPSTVAIWPLRLIQFQVCLVYVSAVWHKFDGPDWLNGTALYYISRLDDLFHSYPLPDFVFQSMLSIKILTWAVLAIESFLPIGLWFKETRRFSIILGLCFHLGIEYTMNLFLFQWLMMLGLLAFLSQTDITFFKKKLGLESA